MHFLSHHSSLASHLLVVIPSVRIRLDLSRSRSGQREERCSLRNLAGFLADILFDQMEQPACAIHFWAQAGSRVQNQPYRLSLVHNDLQITEFFEPVFAEFNANP